MTWLITWGAVVLDCRVRSFVLKPDRCVILCHNDSYHHLTKIGIPVSITCHVWLANQKIKESYNHHMTRLGHKDQESNSFSTSRHLHMLVRDFWKTSIICHTNAHSSIQRALDALSMHKRKCIPLPWAHKISTETMHSMITIMLTSSLKWSCHSWN